MMFISRRGRATLTIVLLGVLPALSGCASSAGGRSRAFLPGPYTQRWTSLASFENPDVPGEKDQIRRAAGWLEQHLATIRISRLGRDVRVIAWKDPSLHPLDPGRLAGYLITDTLWSAYALRLSDPGVGDQIIEDLCAMGWHGNGLHELLFRGRPLALHKPAARDWMHGEELGDYPVGEGRQVDLRVFRQEWDSDFAKGHPSLFLEHAVLEALNDHWNGRSEQARSRIRECLRSRDPRADGAWIFWDARRLALIDRANLDAWTAVREGKQASLETWPFKMALLLYAIRLTGLEDSCPEACRGLRQRLQESQHPDGGVCHSLLISKNGDAVPGVFRSGEATAALVLALSVMPARAD